MKATEGARKKTDAILARAKLELSAESFDNVAGWVETKRARVHAAFLTLQGLDAGEREALLKVFTRRFGGTNDEAADARDAMLEHIVTDYAEEFSASVRNHADARERQS